MLFVAARVAFVQATLREEYAEPWQRLTDSEEPQPARNGRIVTSDGVVLAHDRTEFHVEAHYRWIESPPNERWLLREARSRLSETERRNPDLVEAAKQAVIADRDEAWKDLAAIAPDVIERRSEIQSRVKRIREAVMRKRAERTKSSNGNAVESTNVLSVIWHELTTAPERMSRDPLILVEEIDYHSLGTVPRIATSHVLERPSRFRGMRVVSTPIRDYPQGAAAAHVIGFRGTSVDAEASAEMRTARGVDRDGAVGRAGVEQAYDRTLRGRSGFELVSKRRDGLEVERRPGRHPQHGSDVVLTIDSRIQNAAENALDATIAASETAVGGAAIVLDVRTGAVLTAASAPRLPPTIYRGIDADRWKAINDDPTRPLFPRATRMAIPPGSVFKLVSALASMESGWDPADEIFCKGYFSSPERERCAIYKNVGYGHDRLNISEALGVSCNVFFFELAGGVGQTALRDWAGRCGFGWETGIDVPGESSGRVTGANGFPYPGSVRQFVIGQGDLLVTPLQVARLAAAIGNGGRLVRPRVVETGAIEAEQLSLHPRTLQALQKGMLHATFGPGGTARSLATLPLKIAGKTGSAEVGGGKASHAWFAGYFPADEPRFAIAVAVEHGGSGGKAAAPVAGAIVTQVAAIEATAR